MFLLQKDSKCFFYSISQFFDSLDLFVWLQSIVTWTAGLRGILQLNALRLLSYLFRWEVFCHGKF